MTNPNASAVLPKFPDLTSAAFATPSYDALLKLLHTANADLAHFVDEEFAKHADQCLRDLAGFPFGRQVELFARAQLLEAAVSELRTGPNAWAASKREKVARGLLALAAKCQEILTFMQTAPIQQLEASGINTVELGLRKASEAGYKGSFTFNKPPAKS